VGLCVFSIRFVIFKNTIHIVVYDGSVVLQIETSGGQELFFDFLMVAEQDAD
jgi:hypothetical protein